MRADPNRPATPIDCGLLPSPHRKGPHGRRPALPNLPADLQTYENARVAILPCPFDGTSVWAKGADQGPAALIGCADHLEAHDMELDRVPGEVGIHVLPAVTFAGDEPAEAVERIRQAAVPPLQDGRFVLGLGGEHSVTVGLTRALREVRGPFSVLQIDAHFDLRGEYHGSPYNHACVMRRIAEDDPDCALVAVGIRVACTEEADFARERGVHLFDGPTVNQGKDWIDEAVAALRGPVYVTVDLDGFDPSIMPSTGTPVPGGLGWYEGLELLRRVGEAHEVIGADIVELKPDPVNHHSQYLAAALLYKMVGYFVPPTA